MKIVAGLVFIALVAMVFLRWVLNLGKLGFMMIGIAICVPVGMGCVLILHGRSRLWAILPAALFVILVVLIYREWNRVMKS